MELDDFKKYIKDHQEIESNLMVSEQQVLVNLKGNFKSPINKIMTSLLLELVFTMAFILIFLIVFLLVKNVSIRIFAAFLIVFCIAAIIPLRYLYVKVEKISTFVLPVKSNLEEAASIMKLFTKRYFQITMLSIPVFLIAGFVFGYNEGKLSNTSLFNTLINYVMQKPWLLILAIAYCTLLVVATYYFTKWYLKKLYGQYIDELQIMIAEIS